MQIEIRKGPKYHWLVMDGKRTKIEWNGSPADKAGSFEVITPAQARRDHSREYAAYVASVHYLHGPTQAICHAWTGVINGLGHTGDHRPPWAWYDAAKPFNGGQTVADLPLVAEFEV
jgi:hypothetical protein